MEVGKDEVNGESEGGVKGRREELEGDEQEVGLGKRCGKGGKRKSKGWKKVRDNGRRERKEECMVGEIN